MSVILKGAIPPFFEISNYGYAVLAVYCLLYQSAYFDQRHELSNKPWHLKRDCGGVTNWSHKAISVKLGMGKKKVISCTDILLDCGYIQIAGYIDSRSGSKHRIYRVVHPDMLESVRAAIEIIGVMPSARAKAKYNKTF